MTYDLRITETAEKQLRRLPDDIARLVIRRIHALADDPRPSGTKKLVGGLGWRIRVADYRVIYQVDDRLRTVSIAAVKPRQSAYR